MQALPFTAFEIIFLLLDLAIVVFLALDYKFDSDIVLLKQNNTLLDEGNKVMQDMSRRLEQIQLELVRYGKS